MLSIKTLTAGINLRTRLSQFGWAGYTVVLFAIICLGVFYRFSWVNWSQGANLHPDEYGLTNTLTQLQMPKSLSEYFNTRLSPLSPYPKYNLEGQIIANGPDNRMRWGQWPMIIIRYMAEATGNTGYDELRLMGRSLSALMDSLALLIIYWIGKKLYSWKIGLLAAALSALAVMQIQQSHFMTVDNFSVFFSIIAMAACVQIAQKPCAVRIASPASSAEARDYQPEYRVLWVYAVFGIAFGMAVASKINLLPLGGMLLVAVFISIADLKLRTNNDLPRIFLIAATFMAVAVLVSLVTFRVTQPMSFQAASGDTTIFTIHLNQDWLESMKVAQNESKGIGGGPPAEQWAHRLPVIFPWLNMVLWGMGLPLGMMGWVAYFWAAWRILRSGSKWKSHLLPLIWVGGYFLFMGTRWAFSIRYFLPIYPFLCLLAAWGLIEV